MSYISSNANRFYAALESSYGQVGTVSAANRIPAVKLGITQQLETVKRQDKTGSRTFAGMPPGGRRRTSFDLRTYMTTWQQGQPGPAYGPLFQAVLGAAPTTFAGGTVASSATAGRLAFHSPHNLSPGQAVAYGGEIRFAAAIVDANSVHLNAPFTVQPATGGSVAATVTYSPATALPSVSLFDYWSPATAVQRLLCGAAVDQMDVSINGDFHEFRFRGLAQDVLDSSSFSGGAATLLSFPAEPALGAFDYSIVPGHMGQAWLGSSPTQFLTITRGTIAVKNNLDPREREFGSSLPRAISPGQRSVTAAFDLFSQDDPATEGLYQAARQQSPISVMFQLGEQPGQLLGIYLKSVILEAPEFDDSGNRLQWQFRPARAQGTVDDDIAVAFA